MNRKYIPTYMEIIEFESEDVITESTAYGETPFDENGEGDF